MLEQPAAASTSPAEGKTAGDLEWPLLLERIARKCLSPAAVERARAILPQRTLDDARARMLLVAQTLQLSEEGERLPVRAIPDLAELLERIRRGAVAEAGQLLELTLLLSGARSLRKFATAHRQTHAVLAAALMTESGLDELLEELEVALEEDGSIADAASPELRKARRRVEETRRELVGRLRQLMVRYSEVLRDQYYAEREGRYVLPVRADAHLRVPGIVLGSSASGGTLYVEPQEMTQLGNQLRVAQASVEREEARVLVELSSQARGLIDALEQAQRVCLEADLLAAIAGWASEARARAVMPEAEPVLDLKAMRHPLLIRPDATVVPNDMALSGGSVLVISGPNAGGKTVALKCLGLAAWMARSGIPLPVGPDSRVGWFDPVLTDVGDEQSLLRSLSTFSAHIARLTSFLERSGEHTLVLLDEVVAGTDPEEGSALAAAILEALVESRAAVAVTTHYERLKQLASQDDRFCNASVGFDLAAMAPTFRLALGVPGPSSALAVASRFGIPPEVIEQARALLPEGALRLEELVQKLEAERTSLQAARTDAERDARRQVELLAQLEAERRKAREQERERLAREGRELMVAVREARAQLRQVQERLRRDDSSDSEVREAEQIIDRAAHQVAVGSELATLTACRGPSSEARAARPEELVVGARVYLPKLGALGEIVEAPSRGQVRVMAGAMKLAVSALEVEIAPPGARQSPSRRARPEPGSAARAGLPMAGAPAAVRTQTNTLDLRGQRVEEALALVDAFLDRMLAEGEPAGFVLHGHGTGRLKSAVRAHLQDSPYVERSGAAEADDGGDAFTVFWIKG